MADGTIPEIQARRLRALGAWLGKNGEAIYGTRPWERATGETGDGIPVRFTSRGSAVYAILLGQPKSNVLALDIGVSAEEAKVTLIGEMVTPEVACEGGQLTVVLDAPLPEGHAHTLKIDLG